MNSAKNNGSFDEAISFLNFDIKKVFLNISASIKAQVQEVRLRSFCPVVLVCSSKTYFLRKDSGVSEEYLDSENLIVTFNDIAESFSVLCNHSVYSFQDQISEGFITFGGGHRVGICGTAVMSENGVVNIKDITSLNIRIAKGFQNCSSEIFKIFEHSNSGMLIMGEPSCGKTTILRDLARKISFSESNGKRLKTVIIDERNEISAMSTFGAKFDVGLCDVLSGFPKHEGIIRAIRCLSPNVIICDEIGRESDAEALMYCSTCAVKVIASMHCGNINDFLKKAISKKILENNTFENLILLKGSDSPGKVSNIFKGSDILNENFGCAHTSDYKFYNRASFPPTVCA